MFKKEVLGEARQAKTGIVLRSKLLLKYWMLSFNVTHTTPSIPMLVAVSPFVFLTSPRPVP